MTKFRRNRLTLKGRSAGQRQTHTHTDRQTDRQTDSQTRLKIRALYVCNRANRTVLYSKNESRDCATRHDATCDTPCHTCDFHARPSKSRDFVVGVTSVLDRSPTSPLAAPISLHRASDAFTTVVARAA